MKTQFNFRFFLGLLAAVVVGASAVLVVHAWQIGAESAALKAEADRAEAAGDLGRTADYLKRYLAYRPNDTDALEHYGKTLEKQAQTAAERERVLSIYEDVLAHDPMRHDLRRTTAEMAFTLGWVARAGGHLETLARYRPDDAEVRDLLGQCQEALGDPDKAAASYRDAVELAPARIAVRVRLAYLLRNALGQPSEADQVMDDMVEANGADFTAYLERSIYRIANGSLDDADQDAAHARELAPDDSRVLQTTADLAARRGHTDDARTALRRGLGLHVDDRDLRLALATLELKAGWPKAAAECLEEGRKLFQDKKPPVDQTELINLLVEARLQLSDTRSVEELAAEVRKSGMLGASQYLAARLQMHERRWGDAARTLEESAKGSVLSSEQAVRTLLCLGQCFEHLGDGDRRLDALRLAVIHGPSSPPAGAALGAALLDSGRTDEALEQLRRTTQLPQAPAEAYALLAQALLLRNQTMPENKRNWQAVDAALDRAGPTPEAGLLRAAVLRTRGQSEQATALLDKEKTQHPDQPTAWTALALDAARRGDARGAAAILDDAREALGDRMEFRLARLQANAGVEGDASFKALSDLEKNLDAYSSEDRTLVLCRLAETYFRIGKASDGDRLCRLLTAEPAADLSARLPLLEVVLSSEDDALVNSVLTDIARLEGASGAWQKYGRAALLVNHAGRGDRTGLSEAKSLLNTVAHQRPDWSRVALLQGRLADLEKDATGALDGYQRAFDAGERRLDVAQVLVRMLTERGRWDEADQALRKLQEQMVFHGGMARQAAEIALHTHNDERAAELGRLAAPAVDIYTYHVWFGRLLIATGRPLAGEEELRRAVQTPNAGWDATEALASHLAQHGRSKEAEAVVEELKTTLPARYAALPLAACYEAAGRLDLAEAFYDEALAKRPDDGPTLMRVAAHQLRLNHPERAEPLLRRLLDSGRDTSVSDLAWARRELAMLLAANGDDAHYAEAMTFLGAGPRPGEDAAADRRARAFVLGARSEGRAEALRRLEAEAKAGPLPAGEQFRLVQLYDADEQWAEARERLVNLLTVDKLNPEYLAYLIDGLLRHEEGALAGPWIARLESLESATERVKEFRTRQAAAIAVEDR